MSLQLKCIKCKYIFTDEKQLAVSLSQIRKPANSTLARYIELACEHAVKNVKCPKCLSPVYWIGLGDKSFLREIDVTSQRLVQLVKAVVDIVGKGQAENVSEEYIWYASEIITELIENPGQLVYIADPDLIKEAEKAVNVIWNNVDEEELIDEFFWGKTVDGVYGEGRAGIITSDYVSRAKKLRPSLLSVKPPDEISAYFQNAMECWLFGINTAALILCCSVMETLLTAALNKIDNSLTQENGRYKGLAKLIENAGQVGLLDGDTKTMAHEIRELRRLAVHHISDYRNRNVGEVETFAAIMNTKTIIETLLA